VADETNKTAHPGLATMAGKKEGCAATSEILCHEVAGTDCKVEIISTRRVNKV
jgi:hypothetical protein